MPFSFQVLISSFYVTVNRRLRILRQTIESQGFFRAIFLYFDLRSYYIIIRHSMSWVFSFLTQISFLKWWWFPRLWLRHMSVTTSSTSKTCSLRGRWGKSMLVHKKSTVYKTQSQFLLGWPASLRHLRRLTLMKSSCNFSFGANWEVVPEQQGCKTMAIQNKFRTKLKMPYATLWSILVPLFYFNIVLLKRNGSSSAFLKIIL